MRSLIILFLLKVVCTVGFPENLPLGELGRLFQPRSNLVVCWTAPTNGLPARLWTYRVLPSEFSSTAISNLMALGLFTAKDEDHTRALNTVFNYPNGLVFRNAEHTRELNIFPNLGWIYYDNANVAGSHETNGLPNDEKETLQLALYRLAQLGIDCSQLAVEPNSTNIAAAYILGKLTVFKTNKTHVTFVNLRGVMVARAVDGVAFWAKGARDGFSITFGSKARIAQLEILWRKLKRNSLFPVATPDQFLKWIRAGKAVYEDTGLENFDWSQAKKMTINKVTPYYYGEEHDIVQKEVCPFAMLKSTVEAEKTNLTVYLYCPIIDDTQPWKNK